MVRGKYPNKFRGLYPFQKEMLSKMKMALLEEDISRMKLQLFSANISLAHYKHANFFKRLKYLFTGKL